MQRPVQWAGLAHPALLQHRFVPSHNCPYLKLNLSKVFDREIHVSKSFFLKKN